MPVQPLLPDFGGACLTGVVPGVLGSLYRGEAPPAWMPDPVGQGSQVVLLVLDGLGWQQLADRRPLAPTLSKGSGAPSPRWRPARPPVR